MTYKEVFMKVLEKKAEKDWDDFTDKKILDFDGRRINWEKVLSITKKAPGRIYLPQNLKTEEVIEFKQRFDTIGVKLPPVGFYDANAPSRFIQNII